MARMLETILFDKLSAKPDNIVLKSCVSMAELECALALTADG